MSVTDHKVSSPGECEKGGKISFVGLLVGIAIACLIHISWDLLFPWGTPVPMGESFRQFALVNYSEDRLMFKHGRTKRIIGRNGTDDYMRGPETIVVNANENGRIYLLTEEGLLVSVTDLKSDESDINIITARTSIIRSLGNGRPLGGSFTNNGKTLYIADAVLGLTRIQNIHDSHSKLEIVASAIVDIDTGRHSKLHYVDDLCVGPKTQKVYFTDASEIRPDIIGRNIPDTLYASKIDLLRGIRTGRVLEYDPESDQVRVLVEGMHFANGIGVNKDETFLVFAETFGPRVLKYHLHGNKAGEVEVLVDRSDMIGYPDGIDCSHKNGLCYAVMPSSIVLAHKVLAALPEVLALGIRYLLLMLPRQLAPPVEKFGGLLEINPDTAEFRYLVDPKGQDIHSIFGVTAFEDSLYLGSLKNSYIGLYDLSESLL